MIENYLVAMRIDHVFVRDLNKKAWRVLEFNSDITQLDFNIFFPNFPENIKAQLDNGVVEAQSAEAM